MHPRSVLVQVAEDQLAVAVHSQVGFVLAPDDNGILADYPLVSLHILPVSVLGSCLLQLLRPLTTRTEDMRQATDNERRTADNG